MANPDEFLKYAEECERLARTAAPEIRPNLLAIAKAWRDYAQRADRTQNQPLSADGD